jgi:hypothetical protein
MGKPTWTGLPDLPDKPNPPRDLASEQAENMKALVGPEIWGALERRVMNRDPDEAYFTNNERVRRLFPSEMEPRHQLAVFLNPDSSQAQRDAARESFAWPWAKTSFETLAMLDALRPDIGPGSKQERAALKYLNRHKQAEPTPVTIQATVTLPLLITLSLIIALIIYTMVTRG